MKSRRQNIVDGIKKGAKIGAGTLGTFGVANGLIEGKTAKQKLIKSGVYAANGAFGGGLIGATAGAGYGALRKDKGDKE